MRTASNVASLLFGRARRLILGWLLAHPGEAFFLRQIVRQTGLSPGSVQRELAALVSAGLVSRRTEGRQVYFQADRESPVFPELQSLFVKTAGILDVLRASLQPLGDRVNAAFVFGSAARNELDNRSDVDLLVVGDVSFGHVVNALASVEESLGREVNPIVYSSAEFSQKARESDHFLTSVLNEPHLFVMGDRNELDRTAPAQVGHRSQAHEKRDRRPAGHRQSRSRRKPGRRTHS